MKYAEYRKMNPLTIATLLTDEWDYLGGAVRGPDKEEPDKEDTAIKSLFTCFLRANMGLGGPMNIEDFEFAVERRLNRDICDKIVSSHWRNHMESALRAVGELRGEVDDISFDLSTILTFVGRGIPTKPRQLEILDLAISRIKEVVGRASTTT